MNKARVLHIGANRYPPLPNLHHTAAIWRELARCSSDYHVAARALCRNGSVSTADGVTLHLVGSRIKSDAEFLVTGAWLVRLIRELSPDVLLCQCPVFGGLWACIASRRQSIPLLVELHGEHFFRDRQSTWRARVLQWLARPALRRARSIRVLSADMMESVRKTFGSEIAKKCTVIPTRVDLNVFGPVKKSYETRGPLRLVTVGSFIPLKNHIDLIDAVLEIPDVELTIVGAGPLESSYRNIIAAANAESRIRIHGWVPQPRLASILADHDVYVHFSRTEALSRSILEAMAMGLPVVATDVGFIAGVLEDGENALLLRQPWSASLIAAIHRLSSAVTLREQIGTRGYETILIEYEWSKVFARYREWIGSVA